MISKDSKIQTGIESKVVNIYVKIKLRILFLFIEFE